MSQILDSVDELVGSAVPELCSRVLRFSLVMGLVLLSALMISACAGVEDAARFGPVLSPVQDLVGVELTANRVVSMPCIPSRRDPVGVWLGMQIIDVTISDDAFTLELVETDARLGSHPSGCRDPETMLVQSVFLIDGDDPIFAQQQSLTAAGTRLVFQLDDKSPSDFDVVILPTFEFEMGNGMRQTTIFGLIGRYSMA